MAGIAGADSSLPFRFGAAIGPERGDGIRLAIATPSGAVEYVIRRDVDDWNVATCGSCCDSARGLGVDGVRQALLAFGAVNRGMAGRDDDESRFVPINNLRQGRGSGQIGLVTGKHDELRARWPMCSGELACELASTSKDQDLAHSQAVSPGFTMIEFHVNGFLKVAVENEEFTYPIKLSG